MQSQPQNWLTLESSITLSLEKRGAAEKRQVGDILHRQNQSSWSKFYIVNPRQDRAQTQLRLSLKHDGSSPHRATEPMPELLPRTGGRFRLTLESTNQKPTQEVRVDRTHHLDSDRQQNPHNWTIQPQFRHPVGLHRYRAFGTRVDYFVAIYRQKGFGLHTPLY